MRKKTTSIPKIVLVMPSMNIKRKSARHRIPSNLVCLASQVTPSMVTILDNQTLCWNDKDLLASVFNLNPAVIGITLTTPVYYRCKTLIVKLRKRFPHAVLIAGGKHATSCWKQIAEDDEFDAIVVGEGECVMTQVESLFLENGNYSKEEMLERISRLENVWTREKLAAPFLPEPYDLSIAPDRNYETLVPNLEEYIGDLMIIEFSRGCRGRCSYCLAPTYRKGISFRNVNQVLRELQLLSGKGFTKFFFSDDDFASSPSLLRELCLAMIEAGLKIQYDANMRPDSIIKCTEISHLIKESGCRCIWLGIESGNNSILSSYSKGFNTSIFQEAMHISARSAEMVKTNFIIGAPDDDNDTIMDSIELSIRLREIAPHLPHISYLVPYPGSLIYEQCLSLGLISSSKLGNFLLTTHDMPVMPTRYLSKGKLIELYNEFHNELYSESFLSSSPASIRAEAIEILRSANISSKNSRYQRRGSHLDIQKKSSQPSSEGDVLRAAPHRDR